MSHDEGEDQQYNEEKEDQDHEAMFQFYFQFTKPLALELPSPEDRTLAASWIQRLQSKKEDARLRVDYLKLLLFVMQRGRLIGIFKTEPQEEPLDPFPSDFFEMGNLLLEQAELQGSGDADGRGVSYAIEISNDLKEFVAAQEIPNFGVHVYYAWSMDDPIHKWMLFDEEKFPKYVREKIKQLKAVNSEEKTDLKSSSLLREKSDDLSRKSCDSKLLDKFKTKVKTPQEIEKLQDRRIYYTYMNYMDPRGGSAKDTFNEDDKNWSFSKKGRSCKKDTQLSKMEQEISRFCGKAAQLSRSATTDFDAKGENSEDCANSEAMGGFTDTSRGTRCGGAGPSGREKGLKGGCHCNRPHRKLDAASSKRLQKCDVPLETPVRCINDSSPTAGPRRRAADYSRIVPSDSSGNCEQESMPAEKSLHCSPYMGYEMSHTSSHPSMKTPKIKSPSLGGRSIQSDLKKGCICASLQKISGRSQIVCPCPCPKVKLEKDPCEQEPTSAKKKEKLKSPCPEGSPSARKSPIRPCISLDESTQSSRRNFDYQGVSEPESSYQLEESTRGFPQIKNISELTPPCPPVSPECSPCPCPSYAKRKGLEKREKRPQQPSKDPCCRPCPSQNYESTQNERPGKNKVSNIQAVCDNMKKTIDAHKETCVASGQKTPSTDFCCSGKKSFSQLGHSGGKSSSAQGSTPCMKSTPTPLRRMAQTCFCDQDDYPKPDEFIEENIDYSSDSYSNPTEDSNQQESVFISGIQTLSWGEGSDDNFCDDQIEHSSSSRDNVSSGIKVPNCEIEPINYLQHPAQTQTTRPFNARPMPRVGGNEAYSRPNVPCPSYETPCPDLKIPSPGRKYTSSQESSWCSPVHLQKISLDPPSSGIGSVPEQYRPKQMFSSTPCPDAPQASFHWSGISDIPHQSFAPYNYLRDESEIPAFNERRTRGRSLSPAKESGSGRRKMQDANCAAVPKSFSPPQNYLTLVDDNCPVDQAPDSLEYNSMKSRNQTPDSLECTPMKNRSMTPDSLECSPKKSRNMNMTPDSLECSPMKNRTMTPDSLEYNPMKNRNVTLESIEHSPMKSRNMSMTPDSLEYSPMKSRNIHMTPDSYDYNPMRYPNECFLFGGPRLEDQSRWAEQKQRPPLHRRMSNQDSC